MKFIKWSLVALFLVYFSAHATGLPDVIAQAGTAPAQPCAGIGHDDFRTSCKARHNGAFAVADSIDRRYLTSG